MGKLSCFWHKEALYEKFVSKRPLTKHILSLHIVKLFLFFLNFKITVIRYKQKGQKRNIMFD